MNFNTVVLTIIFMLAVSSCMEELQAAPSCPDTKIVNHTGEWNDYDQATLDKAKRRCGEIYKDAPCLKKFVKKDQLTYNAICGR